MQGNHLGPYEILEQLGAGGMGEVWLAQDTRLGRKVAIKVLPPHFAADPERLARFEQEARAAAALNHPHIAAVFDVGVESGADGSKTHFMVQEYLDGSSLRDRLAAGPVPLTEALSLAREIAEALQAAHAAGIVHRDLKPENVFVTRQGHAKVLDFGLAKLTEPSVLPSGGQTMSPTVVGTAAGVVMGTAGYMSPEQVRGTEVDRRADLFAFGCVLWELLTGERAFAGRTLHQTLDLILSDAPGGTSDAAAPLPAPLRWVLDKCLAKQPAQRYQHADDLVVDLQRLQDAGAAGTLMAPPLAAGDPATVATRAWVPWLLPVAATVALAAAAMLSGQRAGTERPIRFALDVEGGTALRSWVGATLAVAPDGSALIYGGRDDGGTWKLWRRPLDSLEATAIPGTDGADGVAYSPDGRSVAYHRNGEVHIVEIESGVSRRLGNVGINVRGLDWGPDDWIAVGHSDEPGPTQGIHRVTLDGTVETLVEAAADAPASYRYPYFLPGGRDILLAVEDAEHGSSSEKLLAIYSVDRGILEPLPVRGTYPRYVAGHLLFVRRGVLVALPFDLEERTPTGPELVIADAVQYESDTGEAQLAVSSAGIVAYTQGQERLHRLAIVDREGNVRVQQERGRFYREPRVSPDGKRVAMTLYEAEGNDLWIYERERRSLERYTFDGNGQRPAWAAQGAVLTYSGYNEREEWSFLRSPVSAAADREFVDLGGIQGFDGYQDVHPDGETLLFVNQGELWVWTPGTPAHEILQSPAEKLWGTFSPDGRWIAYSTYERGRVMVYITAYPEAGRQWLVSEAGGSEPRWARDGRSLLFRRGAAFLSAAFDPGREPPLGEITELFANDRIFVGSDAPQYDVDNEGNLVVFLLDEAPTTRHVLITGLAKELELLSAARR